ncbi:type IV pilus assembly protein PilA [Anoxybacillus tepidamans]|uniref:Type IV pilus assembly protein PilA n=1 Tax=Anoxybacteroides tepidamans TaxID=265948 RepID=A0A7W8IPY6_9BACL|nr:type II secretion system protein [Anoxybacillus tepidamans]MBB5324575.1 type IV pilus assembly protein PilA [Anoxybacillus tepidamans]
MLKRFLKNQKGLTLIELLAVVVILGIISAIAVPSIGGLIDNSKKDAHVANAQQMINAAKIAVTSNAKMLPQGSGSIIISLKYLEDEGYLETLKDPDGGDNGNTRGYQLGAYPASNQTTYPYGDDTGSYVKVTKTNNKLSYEVKLVNQSRGVQTSAKGPVAENDLRREVVINK